MFRHIISRPVRPGAALARALLPVLLILCPLCALAGQTPLRLAPGVERYDLAPYLEYLEDPSGELSLAQVSALPWSGRFAPLESRGIHQGITKSAFWFRMTITAPPGKGPRPYILDLGQVFLTSGSAFLAPVREAGPPQWLKSRALGRTGRPADLPARFIHFSLDLPPDRAQVLYFRLRSQVALVISPALVTPQTFNGSQMLQLVIYGALLGILLGLACYHLVIFITLRDRSYLWYVLMMLMAIIYFAGMNGLIDAASGPGAGFLDHHLPMVALALMFAFRILFAKSFLPLKQHFAWGDRWLSILLAVFLALSLLVALEPTRMAGIKAFVALGLVFPLFILAAGWACWRGGFAPARFFFWAYLCSGMGVVMFIMGMVFGIGGPFPLYHAHQLGLSAEAVLLALALGHRIKALRLEREALQRAAEQKAKNHRQRLNRLVEELVRVEGTERRAIAEDLHDSVTQDITAGLWRLRSLGAGLDQGGSREADQICQTLNKALAGLRSLTFEISPPELHEHGLGAALAALADRIAARHGLPMEYHASGCLPRLPENLEQALFRMLRELAINAAKHAHADQAVMSLEMSDGRALATLRDNGEGFPVGWDRPGRAQGFGLFSIRERLGIMGGSLEVDSAPGRGSLVTITLPLITAAQAPAKESA